MTFWRRRGHSVLGQQIAQTLAAGMELPEALELLFGWIERRGFFIDQPTGRIGFLYPEAEKKAGWTRGGRPGGTDIEFFAEGDVNLRYWFKKDFAEIQSRLCVFCKTGGDGSMGAFWLDDNGQQRIVHLGSGSGSTLVCVLADNAIDFLRLLAIGYDEICWGGFSRPPNDDGEFIVEPNLPFVDWVTGTFGVSIPETGSEIVKHPAEMGDIGSKDPFWNWVEASVMLS